MNNVLKYDFTILSKVLQNTLFCVFCTYFMSLMLDFFTGKKAESSDEDGKDMASNKETIKTPEKVYR